MSLYSTAYKRRPTGLPLSFGTALEGWYDFKDLSTLFQNSNGTTAVTTDFNPVGYWGDKSGKNRHIIQSTTNDRPTYSSSNGILFNSLTSNLKCVNGATWAGGLSAFTIIFLYSPLSLGSYSLKPTILSFGHATSPYAINVNCDGSFQSTDSVSNIAQYPYSFAKVIINNYLGMYSNVKELHGIVKASATTETGLKDISQLPNSSSFSLQSSYNDLIFGYNPLNQSTTAFNGYIREVIIYSRALQSIEYLNLMNYLIAKHQIDINYTYPSTAPTCPTTTTTTAAPTTTTTAAPTTTTTTTTAAPSSAGYYCVCDPNGLGQGVCGYYTSNPSVGNPLLLVSGPYSTSSACSAAGCSMQFCAA